MDLEGTPGMWDLTMVPISMGFNQSEIEEDDGQRPDVIKEG